MKKELEKLLLSKEEYVVEGRLNKNKILELARNYNNEFLNMLLSKAKIRKYFFEEMENKVLIFKKDIFLQFLNNKEFLPDSFTAYKTKIGLATTNNRFLSENEDIVLNFPYKDCILEGGQSKEDIKRKEVFFNEILAPTEINRLLDNKVFTNFKRFNSNNELEVTNINDDDSFIIKGNNLVTLYSIKDRFAGRIKSIIIDPPYFFNKQKSGDSFNYNSNFKLSTWLTFMKNRLKISKELLSDDGIITIIIGVDGAEYLKLLADEIFEVSKYPKRFVGKITWRKTDNQSNIGDFANVIDYILVYRKNENTKLNKLPLSEKAQREYSYEDNIGKYRRSNILDLTRGRYEYTIKTPKGDNISGPWMISEKDFIDLQKQDGIHWPEKGKQIPYGKTYLKEALENGQITSDMWDASYGTNQRSADEIKSLFGTRIFEYAKPEKLLQNLISLTTNKNDIVLDFFMGSATTQAVALKMDRQFIGIEQMDYIDTISILRLQKVLAGEQGGISEDVEWKGSEKSFVYCELRNDAQEFKISITNATNSEELLHLFKVMKSSSFLSYRINPKNLKEKEFLKFSLAEQKQVLYDLLDNNNLYVNYSDIEDSTYNISANEKKLNHELYGRVK